MYVFCAMPPEQRAQEYNKNLLFLFLSVYTKILKNKALHSYCTSYNYRLPLFIRNTYCPFNDKLVFSYCRIYDMYHIEK